MAQSTPGASIESLPNELLQKIIILTASDGVPLVGDRQRLNYEYLVDIIGRVSKRFKVIASDP